MRTLLEGTCLTLLILVALLLGATVTAAQTDSVPKRLNSPAIAKGLIGGESHDSYVIHARKGQMMTVRITWRREGHNAAQFTVSKSVSFGGDQVTFGKTATDGKRFSGKIPKTGNYYIYVVAHPTASYTLRVTAR